MSELNAILTRKHDASVRADIMAQQIIDLKKERKHVLEACQFSSEDKLVIAKSIQFLKPTLPLTLRADRRSARVLDTDRGIQMLKAFDIADKAKTHQYRQAAAEFTQAFNNLLLVKAELLEAIVLQGNFQDLEVTQAKLRKLAKLVNL